MEEWWEGRKLEATCVLGGIILMGLGIFNWKAGGEPQVKIVSPEANLETTESKKEVVVDVGGAVQSPGVYELVKGARVEEALSEAGGLTGEADTQWAAKYLNRSAKLEDGQKVYIPFLENGPGAVTKPVSIVNMRININLAGQDQLEGLPGVGEVTAKKIIEGRPYQRLEELTEKKVVNSRVFGQIKDQISLW